MTYFTFGAGYVCSFAADSYTLTAGDNPYTFLTDTTARCIPCSLGEYCPQGTFGGPLSSALTYSRARQCPAGFYCPSPAKQIPCSAGTYCIEGSVEEYTCSFTDLVYQDALAEVPSKPTTGIGSCPWHDTGVAAVVTGASVGIP